MALLNLARASTRGLSCGLLRPLSTASASFKAKTMSQVEVDEPHVRERLGQMQMDFIQKAESQNVDRAIRHRHFRRGDWAIAATCVTVALSIYGYTIYAIKQERFLDDFEMPDPLQESERKN